MFASGTSIFWWNWCRAGYSAVASHFWQLPFWSFLYTDRVRMLCNLCAEPTLYESLLAHWNGTVPEHAPEATRKSYRTCSWAETPLSWRCWERPAPTPRMGSARSARRMREKCREILEYLHQASAVNAWDTLILHLAINCGNIATTQQALTFKWAQPVT